MYNQILATLVGLIQTMKLLKFSIKHIVNNALESVAILHVHVIHQTIMASNKTKHENKAGLPWVWGFPWGFPWVWVWYGYGDCDESPWVLWVICGDF